jgi:hypothetical protein
MGFLSDLLLAGGSLGAAIFCYVLARRLRALTGLDSSLGTAIAVLSAQVDDLTRALRSAQDAAQGTSGQLVAQTERAEAVSKRLELLVAALHDLPEPGQAPTAAPRGPRRHRDTDLYPGSDPDHDAFDTPAGNRTGAQAAHEASGFVPDHRDTPPPRTRILRRRQDERAA